MRRKHRRLSFLIHSRKSRAFYHPFAPFITHAFYHPRLLSRLLSPIVSATSESGDIFCGKRLSASAFLSGVDCICSNFRILERQGVGTPPLRRRRVICFGESLVIGLTSLSLLLSSRFFNLSTKFLTLSRNFCKPQK